MQVRVVHAVRAAPDDENPELHEFGLLYFRWVGAGAGNDLVDGAKPAVWVRFSDVSQIETLQFHCPSARLGPSHAFTEALAIVESIDEAERLCTKLSRLLADAQLKEAFSEDTLEDY